MFFSKWIENRKEVAKIFRNTLSGVPQDPVHHAEGDALLHTKLVRASIQPAILELQKLQKDYIALNTKSKDYAEKIKKRMTS